MFDSQSTTSASHGYRCGVLATAGDSTRIARRAHVDYARRMRTGRPRDRYGRPLPGGSRNRPCREGQDDAGPAAGDTGAGRARSWHDACRDGMALFDAQRFFEAHERFEECWRHGDTDEADRPFWKGVTQLAVGCCHVQRGNRRGALALLERARRYLERFPETHRGLHTSALIETSRAVSRQVQRDGASPRLDFPPFPRPGVDPSR